MATLTLKGHTFNAFTVKDASTRRAVLFRNNIIDSLRRLGLSEDDINVPLEAFAMKKFPASAAWYINGFYLYYSYALAHKFAENLYVVSKVIELEVQALLREEKTMEEFIAAFSEEHDVEKERKKAREVLGVPHDTLDIDFINKKYRILAKESHPDMPGGNAEKFKAINHAHKTLKRELE